MKSILTLILTEKCNKRCTSCINKTAYKKHFNKNFLSLDEFRDDNNIEEVQFYGGEPGMLSKEELQSVFDEVCKIKSCKYITIYTNGMFFRRYSLNDFKYNKEIIIFNVIHITKFKDYLKILDKTKSHNNIDNSIVIVLETVRDIKNLYNILKYDDNTFRITLMFPAKFNVDNITEEYFNEWKKLTHSFNMKDKIDNSSDKISDNIFNILIDKNITYNKFKMLLKIDKDKNNDRIKERQSIKIMKKIF